MDIKKARKILGKDGDGQTDEQIQEMINTAQLLAEISIDTILKMSERKRQLKMKRKS
jgi:hypothetical protein